MLTQLNSLRKQESGFTLLELLIVVIVVGILAAIALPIFINQQRAAIDATTQSDVRNTVGDVASWTTENQGVAAKDTTSYLTGRGRITQSNSNSRLGVNINADGTYSVCGYNAGGQKFKSATTVFAYSSATGKFALASSCEGLPDDEVAADNGSGSGSNGGSNIKTVSYASGSISNSPAFGSSISLNTPLLYTNQVKTSGYPVAEMNGLQVLAEDYSNINDGYHPLTLSGPVTFHDKNGQAVDFGNIDGSGCYVGFAYYPAKFGSYFGNANATSDFVTGSFYCPAKYATAAKAASLAGGKVNFSTASGPIEFSITGAPDFSGTDYQAPDLVGSNVISDTSKMITANSYSDDFTAVNIYYTLSKSEYGFDQYTQNVGVTPKATTSDQSFFDNFTPADGATRDLGSYAGSYSKWKVYNGDGTENTLLSTGNGHGTGLSAFMYTTSPTAGVANDTYKLTVSVGLNTDVKMTDAQVAQLAGGHVDVLNWSGDKVATFKFGTQYKGVNK